MISQPRAIAVGDSGLATPPKGGDDIPYDNEPGRDVSRQREPRLPMVRDLVVPEDVLIAIAAYPHVKKAWETSSIDHKEVWLAYIEQSKTPAHRQRRIEILIASLRP